MALSKKNNVPDYVPLIKPTIAESNAFGGKKSNIERLADAASYAEQADLMREMVGDLSNVELMGNRVLVGIYIEPSKRGSLYLAKDTLKESVFQGVVGLVLKLGKQAFKDDPDNKVNFHGQSALEGQWVTFRAGDAKRTQIRGVDCRLVEDTLIDMIVDDPNCITHEKL
jgi:hypothetical protein